MPAGQGFWIWEAYKLGPPPVRLAGLGAANPVKPPPPTFAKNVALGAEFTGHPKPVLGNRKNTESHITS